MVKRDIFQAIADPTRRAILLLLAGTAMTPNSLAEHFDTSRQAVSKHIKILNECDVLIHKKQGREIYYEMKHSRMNEVEEWLKKLQGIWEDRFQQLDDVLLKLNKEKNE